MKKKATILSLVLALTLVFCGFQSVFAGVPGFETKEKITDEVSAEKIAITFAEEYKSGGYGLLNAESVKIWSETLGDDLVIVDTMPPAASYNKYHVPGAVNAVAPMSEAEFTAADKAELIKKVEEKSNTKTQKKYYNKKTKKWQKKKIKGAKTKTVIKSNNPIIVYCGYVGCARSHVAAKYLVEKGYKDVYRFPGGISGWLDAGYPTEAVETASAQ